MNELRRAQLGLAVACLVILVMGPAGAEHRPCSIIGTTGDDFFTYVEQTEGDDVVCGGNGQDVFSFTPGNDVFRGGQDGDTASYVLQYFHDTWKGIHADLSEDRVIVRRNPREVDIVRRVEHIVGSPRADYIAGQAGQGNLLDGGRGKDEIHSADDGWDRVKAGRGVDTCYVDEFDSYFSCEVVV